MNTKEHLEEYKTLKGNTEEMKQPYDNLISKAEYRGAVIDGMPRSQNHENTQEVLLSKIADTKTRLDELRIRLKKQIFCLFVTVSGYIN